MNKTQKKINKRAGSRSEAGLPHTCTKKGREGRKNVGWEKGSIDILQCGEQSARITW